MSDSQNSSEVAYVKPKTVINGACMCLKNRSRSTAFLDLFYGKSEVSVKTLLIFLFYCGQVSRETFVKMVDILLSFFWHQKWNWLMVSWISRGIKLWNRHIRSGKKMKLTAAAHDAKKMIKEYPPFLQKFHVKLGHNKIKK